MEELKDYAIKRACKKCGWHEANSYYMDNCTLPGLPREIIQKICNNCGYLWYELPLDVYKELSSCQLCTGKWMDLNKDLLQKNRRKNKWRHIWDFQD